MRWLTNLYDFRLKGRATAGIGIHPTKAWLSQLMNFKNAIWMWGHFRRMICNKILFSTWKKGHRNGWNTSDCFWGNLHESSISFSWHKRFKEGRESLKDGERCGRFAHFIYYLPHCLWLSTISQIYLFIYKTLMISLLIFWAYIMLFFFKFLRIGFSCVYFIT